MFYIYDFIGSRRVTDKDSICVEEDAALSDYLSKCKFREEEYRMHLPNENDCQIPEGFECRFYREANERIFEATIDGECYTVVVWDEKGWDSDSSQKRRMEQVCTHWYFWQSNWFQIVQVD